MATKVINTILNLKNASMLSGLKQVEGSVNSLTGSMGRFTKKGKIQWATVLKSVDKFATGALMGIGTAGAAFTAFSVKTGSEFSSAMSEVGAITDATGDEMTTLKNLAKEMGDTTVKSATEAAEAMKYMGMAGWSTEDIESGLKGVLDLSTASGADLSTTSDIVTDALSGFKMSASDTTEMVNVLAEAARSSNTDVEQMGESFQYIGAICGTAGVSVEDASVALGMMANQSIKGSKSGTAFRKGLQNLISPSKSAAEAMEKYGVQLKTTDDGSVDLISTIDNLRDKLGGLSGTDQAAALSEIFGTNASTGWAAIVNETDENYQSLKNSIEAAGQSGSTVAADMAAEMSDNIPGAIEMLKSHVGKLGLDFYDKIEGPLKDGINQITDTIGSIDWEPLMDALANVVTNGFDLLSNALTFLGEHGDEIVRFLPTLVSGIVGLKVVATIALGASKLNKNFKKLSGGMSIVQGAAKLMTNPMTAIPIVIGLVIVGVVLLITHWKQIVSWFHKFVNAHPGVKKALNAIKGGFTALGNAAKAVFSVMDKLGSKISGVIDKAKAAFSKVKSVLGLSDSTTLDGNANGTSYYGGGWTRINERGGEIAYLPSGSTIIPADKSERIASGMSGGSTVVNVTIQGNVIGNEAYADYLGNYIVGALADVM
jgi:TP901 family phage tail tape measure protein